MENEVKPFLSLEDRFLVSLYEQNDYTPIRHIASSIAITENALLSIIHRVSNSYPHYVTVQDENQSELLICPNRAVDSEVKSFLEQGGFTAINEQEFLEYYQTELEQYNKLERLQIILKKYQWIKWIIGTTVAFGIGLGLVSVYKAKKEGRL